MTVYERWSAFMGELPGFPKADRNQQQGFDFRSIDSVLPTAKSLAAKHGVFIVPLRQRAERSERHSARGTALFTCYMRVDWRVYGTDGDYFDAQTYGEATDAGDKSTSKAQTMALKYLLWPALMISDPSDDADRETPEEVSPVALEKDRAAILERITALPEETQKRLKAEWKSHPDLPSIQRIRADQLQVADELVSGYEEEANETPPEASQNPDNPVSALREQLEVHSGS